MRSCRGLEMMSAGPPLDHNTFVHKDDRIGHLPGESHLVGHHHHRHSASASFRITASASPTSSGSSAEVGSSKRINLGAMASARAIATRCCWPPDSSAGRPALPASPTERVAPWRGRPHPASSACARESAPRSDSRAPSRCGEEVELLEDHADLSAPLANLALPKLIELLSALLVSDVSHRFTIRRPASTVSR